MDCSIAKAAAVKESERDKAKIKIKKKLDAYNQRCGPKLLLQVLN
jgi:hypothetical protein